MVHIFKTPLQKMCLGKCISYLRSLSKCTLKLFFGGVSLLTSRDSVIVDAILLLLLFFYVYALQTLKPFGFHFSHFIYTLFRTILCSLPIVCLYIIYIPCFFIFLAIKQLINMDHLFNQFFQIILIFIYIYMWYLSIYRNIIKFHY